jgi:hypothetical protein
MNAEGVNEKLNEADQMELVRRMNNIVNLVDEIMAREGCVKLVNTLKYKRRGS